MKKYLIDFGHGVQCKNKLEQEINEFARTYHRVWISESEFKSTLKVIQEKVDALNKKHNRCKPSELSVHDNRDGDMRITFGGDGFCRLEFLSFWVR